MEQVLLELIIKGNIRRAIVTTLCSLINSTAQDPSSVNGHTLGYIHRLNILAHLVQHKNKQHHVQEVLLSSFHLNGHTLGFHPQTQMLEALYTG